MYTPNHLFISGKSFYSIFSLLSFITCFISSSFYHLLSHSIFRSHITRRPNCIRYFRHVSRKTSYNGVFSTFLTKMPEYEIKMFCCSRSLTPVNTLTGPENTSNNFLKNSKPQSFYALRLLLYFNVVANVLGLYPKKYYNNFSFYRVRGLSNTLMLIQMFKCS